MLLYLKGIILYSQSHIKQSRSIFSIFHLLKGKRGIQTVHDSRIFGLDLFYGIYPSLDKKLFEKQIEMFVNESYLIKSNRENVYSLTKKGHVWLENYLKHLRLDYYNGLTFNQKAEVFFERLLLSIQTYANIHMKSFSFIPVIDNTAITNWVKNYYSSTVNVSPEEILYSLYTDLSFILNRFTDFEAEFFLDHFSGYKRYGMSTNQLSKKYNLNMIDIPLLRIAILHKMLFLIDEKKENLTILPSFMLDKSNNPFITNTTMQTYNLLEQGLSPEEIQFKRNLKLNTIYDHIVEISLFDKSFDISKYVDGSIVEEIKIAIENTKTHKLKDIKEKLSSDISYFQIRLVLTRIN